VQRDGGLTPGSWAQAQQPLAKALAEVLRARGLTVWIDLDSMNADVMAAMASAVLSSSCIFVLVSTGYIHSANCRREASFAAERKKKIVPLLVEEQVNLDSWLGMLIAGLLRYPVSAERLAAEIDDVLAKEALERVALAGASVNTKPVPPDVQAWLHAKGCGELEQGLRACDALDFATLRNAWRRGMSAADWSVLLDVKRLPLLCAFMDALEEVFA